MFNNRLLFRFFNYSPSTTLNLLCLHAPPRPVPEQYSARKPHPGAVPKKVNSAVARALAFCLPVLRVASASRTQATTAEGPRWQPNRMPAAPAAIPRRQQKKEEAQKTQEKNKALASVETLASKSPGLAGGLLCLLHKFADGIDTSEPRTPSDAAQCLLPQKAAGSPLKGSTKPTKATASARHATADDGP